MAQKSKSQTTTSSSKKSVSFSYFLNILSFCAVIICGVALAVAFVLGKCGISASITGKLQSVANAFGWIVLCILSYGYIKHRRKIWMWVLWVVAVVAIVVINIMGIFGI